MATETLYKRYLGQHFDNFVIDNGMPYSEYKLKNGAKLYRWNSKSESISMPTRIEHSGNHDYSGHYSSTSKIYEGGGMKLECALNIIVDNNMLIQEITITNDTLGHWEMSKCNEVFG
jgi:hypothetical protein